MDQSGGAGVVQEAQPHAGTIANGVSSRWDQPSQAAEQPPPLPQQDGAPQEQSASATDDGRGRSRKRNRRDGQPNPVCSPHALCYFAAGLSCFRSHVCKHAAIQAISAALRLRDRAVRWQVGRSRDSRGRYYRCGGGRIRPAGRSARGWRRGARRGAAEEAEPVGDEGGAAQSGAGHVNGRAL